MRFILLQNSTAKSSLSPDIAVMIERDRVAVRKLPEVPVSVTIAETRVSRKLPRLVSKHSGRNSALFLRNFA